MLRKNKILGLKNKLVTIKVYQNYVILLNTQGLYLCKLKINVYKWNGLNIYFINKKQFNLFFSYLKNIIMGNKYEWSVCLLMTGLGFRTYYNKKLDIYKLHIGYTHDIYIKDIVKKGLSIKTRKKFGVNYIYIKSWNYEYLMSMVHYICNLRVSSLYKKKGIWQLTRNIKLKVGKQKNF